RSLFCCRPTPRRLRSSPTRRSPDLPCGTARTHDGILLHERALTTNESNALDIGAHKREHCSRMRAAGPPRRSQEAAFPRPPLPRSEEHTSELQSRENLVCRLLLEKK